MRRIIETATGREEEKPRQIERKRKNARERERKPERKISIQWFAE